jgi:hypothetical protein
MSITLYSFRTGCRVFDSNNGLRSNSRRQDWRQILTPRFIILFAVACVVSLLLSERFVSIVIFADVCVVSLLLPERFISILARLAAGACILLFGLVVYDHNYFAGGYDYKFFTHYKFYIPGSDLFIRLPFLYRLLHFDSRFAVFLLYGLPLFLAFALVAIEKRRLSTPR